MKIKVKGEVGTCYGPGVKGWHIIGLIIQDPGGAGKIPFKLIRREPLKVGSPFEGEVQVPDEGFEARR